MRRPREQAGERREQLDARGIAVTEGKVEQVEADAHGLTGVRLSGGRRVALDAVIAAPRMTARAELLAPLGLKPAEVRLGEHVVGTRIEADHAGATAVPGVWVAGNIAVILAQNVGSDLTMQDQRGDIGVVRRHLAPALVPVPGAHADQRDVLGGEGLDADDARHCPSSTPFAHAAIVAQWQQ